MDRRSRRDNGRVFLKDPEWVDRTSLPSRYEQKRSLTLWWKYGVFPPSHMSGRDLTVASAFGAEDQEQACLC